MFGWRDCLSHGLDGRIIGLYTRRARFHCDTREQGLDRQGQSTVRMGLTMLDQFGQNAHPGTTYPRHIFRVLQDGRQFLLRDESIHNGLDPTVIPWSTTERAGLTGRELTKLGLTLAAFGILARTRSTSVLGDKCPAMRIPVAVAIPELTLATLRLFAVTLTQC